MKTIELHPKYEPLADLQTRYAVITGGRGSGKSYALATLLIALTFRIVGKTILFTRYTLTNAETSIIPEFTDKIDQGNLGAFFDKSGNDIVNTRTGTRILFRGIRTSSGINTAALKSIPGLVLWVNDESEELVDETIFDTIDFSIRDKNSHCEVWLAMNPADVNHFIYKRFFAGNGVQGGFNGAKGDVTYIHTTYFDNLDNLDADFILRAEKMKESNEAKYRHIFLGEWEMNKEGLIYKNWRKIRPEEYPSTLPQWYGVDWGYTDWPNAMVRMCYDPAKGILYLWQVKMVDDPSEARLTRGAAKAIIADCATLVHHTERDENGVEHDVMYQPYDCECYCDPARPENIAELRTKYDISAMKAINKDKVGRIHYLQGFQVCYVGDDIEREVVAYSWQRDKLNKGLFIDKPVDGNDHCFVADTLIATPNGNKRIADIREGDMVLTSQGPKYIRHLWRNGYKIVCKYTLSFVNCTIQIIATEEHRIKTKEGWKQLKYLSKGDELFLLKSSTANYTNDTQEQSISQGTNTNCTGWCGSSTLPNQHPSIAPTNACPNIAETSDLTILRKSAQFAESTLTRTSIDQTPSAQICALLSIAEERLEMREVFDLEVDEAHEYFANSVLVHNCMDAISYGATRLRGMGVNGED